MLVNLHETQYSFITNSVLSNDIGSQIISNLMVFCLKSLINHGFGLTNYTISMIWLSIYQRSNATCMESNENLPQLCSYCMDLRVYGCNINTCQTCNTPCDLHDIQVVVCNMIGLQITSTIGAISITGSMPCTIHRIVALECNAHTRGWRKTNFTNSKTKVASKHKPYIQKTPNENNTSTSATQPCPTKTRVVHQSLKQTTATPKQKTETNKHTFPNQKVPKLKTSATHTTANPKQNTETRLPKTNKYAFPKQKTPKPKT